MASKTKTTKAQTVYALVLYGGGLKTQMCVVKVFTEDPEDEFETYKEFYGPDIKGRYVKCTKPLNTVNESVFEDLESYKINDLLYKLSVTEIVKILKKATDAKKCSTLGVYNDTENDDKTNNESEDKVETTKKTTKTKKVESEDEVEAKPVKKTVAKTKKVEVESEDEVEVETKPVETKTAKKTVAKTKKVESEDEVETKSVETKTVKKTVAKTKKVESEDEVETKPVETKTVKKTVSKSKKVELDDDLDDDIEVNTKLKGKTTSQLSKTRIVLSDDDDEEETA